MIFFKKTIVLNIVIIMSGNFQQEAGVCINKPIPVLEHPGEWSHPKVDKENSELSCGFFVV
jgi:hypothetical protein